MMDAPTPIPKCAACSAPMPDPSTIRVRLSKCRTAATFYCAKHPLLAEPTPEITDKIVGSLLWDLAEKEFQAQEQEHERPRPLRGPDLLRWMAGRRNI